ncbi:cyclic pyranopterin monophosphate synthase MoaC [Halobacteriovorax sp. JY17]|uniref:cyclic pyranopterin monophosphate synthase MoaC n=1 Tax=Halobacteriovorax sp. JY17 TaxID=2014617 RepID=UPI000C3C9B74|nr:cyclic pyranopterin monophosphate synthase MoaC [Halobacteriovorax sp. JY17]PIK15205.1 MAG: cyclic pyranopterin monophosphate synthase MoaC [Halobacteriovorax sp. JY17]
MLTHIDQNNMPSMVDVSAKEVNTRVATAESSIQLPESMREYFTGSDFVLKKGPVFQTAIIAATMAVKKTHETIPLCHQIPIESCKVNIQPSDSLKIIVTCTVKTSSKTGIEMEAMHGAVVACLTIYDMCKAVSHEMILGETKLLQKSGGKRLVFNRPLRGLVLTGGKSSRMKRDKALIEYQGVPHAEYIKSVLGKVCDEVYLSAREGQWSDTSLENIPTIFDSKESEGPISGILTAFEKYPDSNWIIVACDLPYFNEETISQLLENYCESSDAIAFKNSDKDFAEPLCTLYTPKAYSLFKTAVEEGTSCPVKVLKNARVKTLLQSGVVNLANINTPLELEEVKI